MSHSLIYLGESAYDMQEFVNSMAKFVITREDNRKGVCGKSQQILCKFLLEKSCCCAKACHSWLQPPSGNEFCCPHLLGPWAVFPQWGCSQHSPSSVPSARCSWGSLTYAILWLVQDIQYFTKTLSSGKQCFTAPHAACVCSFLSWPQTWCLAINSCLQNANEPLLSYSSWVQLPFSWHIKYGHWVF